MVTTEEELADLRTRVDIALAAWWACTEPLDDGLVGYRDEQSMETALDAIWEAIGTAPTSHDAERSTN